MTQLVIKIAGTGHYASTPGQTTHQCDSDRMTLCLAGCMHLYGNALMPNLTRHINREYRQLLINEEGGLKSAHEIKDAADKMQLEKCGKKGRTHAYTSTHDDVREKVITSIVIVGISRGGTTAFLLAKMLHEQGINLPVKIITDEPVPGTPSALRACVDLSQLEGINQVDAHIALAAGIALTSQTFPGMIEKELKELGSATIAIIKFAKNHPNILNVLLHVAAGFWALIFTVFFRQQMPQLSQDTPCNIMPKASVSHYMSYTYRDYDNGVYTNPETVPYPWKLQYTRGISRAALYALMQIDMSAKAQCAINDAAKELKELCWSLKKLCPHNSRLRAFVEFMQYRADFNAMSDDDLKQNIDLLHQAFQLSCPEQISEFEACIPVRLKSEHMPGLSEGANKDSFFVSHHILNERHGSKTVTTASALTTAVFSIAALSLMGMCFSHLEIARLVPILMMVSIACAAAGLVSLVTATGAGIFHHCQLKKQAQLLADNASGVSAQN